MDYLLRHVSSFKLEKSSLILPCSSSLHLNIGVKDHHDDIMTLMPSWEVAVHQWSCFRKQQRHTQVLSKRYRTFSINPQDLESSTHRKPGYDTAIISKLLGESLPPVLGASYHLVGHDVGAWIAYPWAAQFPSRVKKPYPAGRRNTWSSCTANLSAAIRGEFEDVAILLQCPPRAA
jgi:hypothetical protein